MANKYVRSGAAGAGTGADWANAYTKLATALAGASAGDDLWVSEDHAESTAGAITLTSPGTPDNPCRIICVNHSGSVPPVSADLRTTATITTTGAGTITLAGSAYYYGITFNVGTGASAASFNVGSGTAGFWIFLDSCKIALNTTSGSSVVAVGSSAATSLARGCRMNNTTLSFGDSLQTIVPRCPFVWENTAGAIQGTAPLLLFTTGTIAADVTLVGIDLSALGSGSFLTEPFSGVGAVCLFDCKLGASVGIDNDAPAGRGVVTRLVNCDSADTNYRYHKGCYQGTISQETTVVRSGGATDGTTPVSRVMNSTANSKLYSPLESDWMVFWDDSPGGKTVTVHTLTDGVTLTNADCWAEVEYLGTPGFPQGKFASSRVADVLASGSNYPADSTSGWTTTGLAAPVKQSMSVTFTTTGKGPARVRVCLAKPSAAVYFDPLVLSGSGRQYQGGEQYLNEGAGGGVCVDPGVGNVLYGVSYTIDGQALVGTLGGPPPEDGDAQVIELADACANAVRIAWNASSTPPGASDAVTRVYEVPLADAEFAEAFSGRQVWVFPAEYGRQGMTRRQDNFKPRIAVVVAERYAGVAPVPTSWLDVRTSFVEQVVFLPLADPRRAQILTGVTPEDDGATVVVYDAELLVQQRLFLSFITVQYRLQYP